MTSKVQTVLADISPDKLGKTLTHEHLGSSFTHFYRKPPTQINDKFTGDLNLHTIGFIRQYPYSSVTNTTLNDEPSQNLLLDELRIYKRSGGGSIVENSSHGLDRNIQGYAKMAHQTGIHIVAGSGFYINEVQPVDYFQACKEDIYALMLKEMTEGTILNYDSMFCPRKASGKSGFLGGIASVWPVTDFERRVIEAVGELQAQLNCGVSFHPPRDPAAPSEIMRLYAEAGGRLDKAVMSHVDRTPLGVESLDELASLGCYCQFNNFGAEMSYYDLNLNTSMPTDAQRLELMRHLVDEGKSDRILMSHGIHTKHRLTEFGGHGYSHILTNIMPRMRTVGLSQQIIDEITITNPANWLSMPA